MIDRRSAQPRFVFRLLFVDRNLQAATGAGGADQTCCDFNDFHYLSICRYTREWEGK